MNAITTFLNRLAFAATCVLGWAIFPVLIAVGAAVLLAYAFIAEAFSSAADATCVDSDALAPRASGLRLPATLHPQRTPQP